MADDDVYNAASQCALMNTLDTQRMMADRSYSKCPVTNFHARNASWQKVDRSGGGCQYRIECSKRGDPDDKRLYENVMVSISA
jgi:hypothetical protein